MFSLFAAVVLAAALPGNWLYFRNVPTANAVVPAASSVTWKVATGGPISASPTTDGQNVYIGNNAGYVNAIDLASGQVLWTRHLSNAVMTAPLLYDGLVIVGMGDELSTGSAPGAIFVGIGPSALDAFEARSGATRWHAAVAGSAMSTPAIVNGILVHVNGAGWLTALNPKTGQKLYARNLQSLSSMSASIPAGGDLFVTAGVLDNAIWQLKASTGATVWRTAFSSEGSGHGDCPPVTDGTRVFCNYMMPVPGKTYTIAGDKAVQHAYALDLKTGAKLWDVALDTGVLPPRNEAAIPLLYGNRLYFGSCMVGEMHALDLASGRVIWQTHVRGVVKGGLVAVDGVVYFGDLAGYLWALDANTGKIIGNKKMPSGFNVGSPIVVGRTLVVGSRTGTVYALPLDDIRSSHDS
jgi:outer membrane protein assembly factor BamB